MLSRYLLQVYILFFGAFLFYPEIAEPPFYFLSAFFLIPNFWLFLLICMYLVILEGLEREIGTNHFAFIYILGAIAGNISLLSIYFNAPSALPIVGAISGVMAVFGVYIARHPYDLAIFEGLPMLAIIGLILLTVGHIVLFGKFDFLPILCGVVYGYYLPKDPLPPQQPPKRLAAGRY
ncbi:MAG: rhomboid family intramembrane serine protease [Candidatus Micrarchaeota archaeon]